HSARVSAGADDARWHHDFLRAAENALAARDRVQRRSPANRAITSRSESVDIGPRALARRIAVVLFEGRVTRRDEDRERIRAAERLPCRAEVEQHRPAVATDVDVVRLDVAMDEARVVNQLETVEDRQ